VSLTRYKVGGEDLADIYVDTTTVEDSLDDTIPSSILTPEGVEALLARSLWVWGSGTAGSLGLNNTISRSSPVQLGSLTNWIHGAATGGATKTDGTLWTWGDNTRGRLGLGDTLSRSSPVQVGTNTNWAKFTVSSSTSFAITDSSSLWTWGEGVLGVQGRNTNVIGSYNTTPNQVGTVSNWKDVTCVSSYSRVVFPGGPPPRTIINRRGFAIGLRTDGTLWSWGAPFRFLSDSNDGFSTFTQCGYTGLNDTIARSSPTQIGTDTDWKEIGIIIALKKSGSIWSWGPGTSGILGLNTTFNRSSPTQIGTDTDWKEIDRNGNAAIKNNGSLWMWGGSGNGFLGLNDTIYRSSPTQIGSLLNWRSIITGSPSLALKTDGTLWSWGQNSVGGSGLNDIINRSSPVQVGTDTNWRKAGPGTKAFK
jgi:alpha-tubulin suppressor-like RCC1 family protein